MRHFALIVTAFLDLLYAASNKENVVSRKHEEELSGLTPRKIEVFRNQGSADGYKCLTLNNLLRKCTSDARCPFIQNYKRDMGEFADEIDREDVCKCSSVNETFYARTRSCQFGFDTGV